MSELREHNELSAGTEPQTEVSAENPVLSEALREWIARHRQPAIEPLAPEAYKRVLEDFLTLAGTEPDLVAPPRRHFD